VSFLGDYGLDIKKSSTHTSAQNPSNIFSAYQNQNINHAENTSKTTSSAQVFFFKTILTNLVFIQKFTIFLGIFGL